MKTEAQVVGKLETLVDALKEATESLPREGPPEMTDERQAAMNVMFLLGGVFATAWVADVLEMLQPLIVSMKVASLAELMAKGNGE